MLDNFDKTCGYCPCQYCVERSVVSQAVTSIIVMKMIVLCTKDEGLMLQQHNRVQQTCLVILLMLIHACSIRSGQMHEI